MVIQRMVRILKQTNSAPKPFHTSRLRQSAPPRQHPKIPTPPRSKSRPTPAVCISRDADSTRNSFNARGLCAKTPLNQHRKLLHPLAWPLRLLSQGPQAQIPHGRKEDGSLPDANGLTWFSSQGG